MDLENLDLSRWIKNQKQTKMSGLFNMDATLDEGLVLDQINMNIEMVEEKLFNQEKFLFMVSLIIVTVPFQHTLQ